MDILEFAKKLGANKHRSARNDDVFIDRLNHRYTVTMILVFAAIVTTQQYFGSPITCWVPAQFTTGYEKYANDICWIMNTYYIPLSNDIPQAEVTRYERTLKYYQWSPFILMFMALCFYFPRMIWRSLNNRSGLDIENLVNTIMKQEQTENLDEQKKKTVTYIANSIRTYIENRLTSLRVTEPNGRRPAHKIFYNLTFWRHRHISVFIVLLFTFVKFLFLFNSVLQIILLNAFLGNDYHLFGIDIIRKLVNGLDWGESKRFPRVTLCDFHIREVGIIHRYTVQCVLPINLFNEKIFLILWFWILLLVVFNLCDFIPWLIRILDVKSRSHYVERKLIRKGILKHDFAGPNKQEQRSEDKRIVKSFVRDYLQEDGCFALRLLARNGQDIIVSEVIEDLYEKYRAEYHCNDKNSDSLRIDTTKLRDGPTVQSPINRRVPITPPPTTKAEDSDQWKLLEGSPC